MNINSLLKDKLADQQRCCLVTNDFLKILYGEKYTFSDFERQSFIKGIKDIGIYDKYMLIYRYIDKNYGYVKECYLDLKSVVLLLSSILGEIRLRFRFKDDGLSDYISHITEKYTSTYRALITELENIFTVLYSLKIITDFFGLTYSIQREQQTDQAVKEFIATLNVEIEMTLFLDNNPDNIDHLMHQELLSAVPGITKLCELGMIDLNTIQQNAIQNLHPLADRLKNSSVSMINIDEITNIMCGIVKD